MARRRRDGRSRNGCVTCKQRRVKCDEARPQCTRCAKLGRDCAYRQIYTFEDDAMAKGIMFGRSRQSQLIHKQRCTFNFDDDLQLTLSELSVLNEIWIKVQNHYLFVNAGVADFTAQATRTPSLEPHGLARIYDLEGPVGPVLCLWPGPLFSPVGLQAWDARVPVAYQFMVETIFPNCICYGHKKNPYLDYLVPLSTNSSILFKALVSYSAKVYSLMHDRDFEGLSEAYKTEVLAELPQLIQAKRLEKATDWEEILGTILILCSSNISSDCDMQWIIHSEGAKKILQYVQMDPKDPFKRFFMRYLTSHEIMRETIKSPPTEDNLEQFKNEDDDEIDPMLGCSPTLLRLVNETTKIGEYLESLQEESEPNKTILTNLLASKKNSVLDQLLTLQQTSESQAAGLIAEIKRLTAVVYLYARADPSAVLENLIDQIVAKIKLLDYVTMALVWPLYVIGIVGTLSEQTRWFILNKFEQMEKLRSLASVKLARAAVENAWKKRDLRGGVYTWKQLVSSAETISLA